MGFVGNPSPYSGSYNITTSSIATSGITTPGPVMNRMPPSTPLKAPARPVNPRMHVPAHGASSRNVPVISNKRGRKEDTLVEEPPARRQRGESCPRRAMWEGVTICTLNLRGLASNSNFVETQLPVLVNQLTGQLSQLTEVNIKDSRLVEVNFHGKQHDSAENTKEAQQEKTVINPSPAIIEAPQENIVNPSTACIIGQQDSADSSPKPESEFDSESDESYNPASISEESDPEEYNSDYTSEVDGDHSSVCWGENESGCGSSTSKDGETQEGGDDGNGFVNPLFAAP